MRARGRESILEPVLALAALLVAAAIAAGGPAAAQAAPELPKDRWNSALVLSNRLLQAGSYAQSLEISQALLLEMAELLGPGPEAAETLVVPLVHRALAQAGLGRPADATWDWQVAQALLPAVTELDLAPYGEPGRFLAAVEPAWEGPCEDCPPEEVTDRPVPRKRIHSPRVTLQEPPVYPPGLKASGIEGDLLIQVVVDREGNLGHPRVLESLPAPTLTFVALETLRRWRFQPATWKSQAVPVFYRLTVHFRPPD